MVVLLVAFLAAAMFALLIVRSGRRNPSWVHDYQLDGPQKFHVQPVPRVGGLAIVLGVAAAYVALATVVMPGSAGQSALIMLCSMPAFVAGLAEDVTKRVSPRRRLICTAMSAGLAFWLVDATIVRTDIAGLDTLVSFWFGSLLVTVFVVAGVANAINIIDGFNGLASMCTLMMLASISYVAFQVGDPLLGWLALAGVGAVLGFFVFNFPAGLIFLGDGGAYFLGFYVAELAILLLARNPAVSPMFPLLLCIYPVFETLFSIYRRKWLRGAPMGMPDGAHLHSLIYRRVIRWAAGERTARALTRRNSMTSPYLWILCSLSLAPAVFWYDSTAVQAVFIVLFGLTYVLLYWRIVRFRAPRWLVLKHRTRR